MTLTEPAQQLGDSLAVRVDGVSKSYGLWSSPSARIQFPFINTMRRVTPAWLGMDSILEAKTRQMYREFKALENVSLEIAKGESWGIIGVNGSGKSTLLKMIAGNLRPTTGRVEVDGKVATTHPDCTAASPGARMSTSRRRCTGCRGARSTRSSNRS